MKRSGEYWSLRWLTAIDNKYQLNMLGEPFRQPLEVIIISLISLLCRFFFIPLLKPAVGRYKKDDQPDDRQKCGPLNDRLQTCYIR